MRTTEGTRKLGRRPRAGKGFRPRCGYPWAPVCLPAPGRITLRDACVRDLGGVGGGGAGMPYLGFSRSKPHISLPANVIIKEVFQETPVRDWRSKTGKGRRSVKGAAPGSGPRKAALVQGGVRKQWRSYSRKLFISLHPGWEGHRPRRCLPSEGVPGHSHRCGPSGSKSLVR